MPKYEIGIITSYYDAVTVEAENEEEARKIAVEMNARGEIDSGVNVSEVEYMLLTEIRDS